MHGDSKNQIIPLLGYSFAPALSCLLSGQITIFVLFGLALFLWLHRTSPFLAGLSLWFCLLKPHLFLPFGTAMLVWIVLTRSYKVLAGIITSIVISSTIGFLLDPSAWAHYGQLISSRRPDLIRSIPCLSIILRQRIGPAWVQYLPAAAGCVWAFTYFLKHREDWDWMHHGSLLMLVSILVAPYTWFMDQAILIPALLHGAHSGSSSRRLAILAMASAVIEVQLLRGVPLLTSLFYLWTAPAWLAWYLWVMIDFDSMKAYDPCPSMRMQQR